MLNCGRHDCNPPNAEPARNAKTQNRITQENGTHPVTGEKRSNKQRQNRPIPSVCDDFSVKSCDQWDFGRALDFRTDWNRPSATCSMLGAGNELAKSK